MSRCASGLFQSKRRFALVEVDVASFLAHDARQQVAQHGMARQLAESRVARLGRPLVDRAPGEVQGAHRGEDAGRHLGDDRAQAIMEAEPFAHRGHPLVVARLAVGLQDLADCLAVPVFLVGPDRQEVGHRRVTMQARHEQVAQVADGVVLDVVHVAQAAQCVRVERLCAECLEVDAVEIEGVTAPLPFLPGTFECRCHVCSTERAASLDAARRPYEEWAWAPWRKRSHACQ